MRNFVDKVFAKDFVFDDYPAPRNVEMMNEAIDRAQKDSNMKLVTQFIRTWGLDNSTNPKNMEAMIRPHRLGEQDMDKQGELTAIMNGAKADYKEIAADEVAALSWIKYRNAFRQAFYEMADSIKKSE